MVELKYLLEVTRESCTLQRETFAHSLPILNIKVNLVLV